MDISGTILVVKESATLGDFDDCARRRHGYQSPVQDEVAVLDVYLAQVSSHRGYQCFEAAVDYVAASFHN